MKNWPDTWQNALKLYDSLTSPGWEHIPSFRQFVARLATARQAKGLFAMTSHERLTISPYSAYPDFFGGRRVALYPMKDGTVVIERFETSGPGPTEKLRLPIKDAEPVVLDLLERFL